MLVPTLTAELAILRGMLDRCSALADQLDAGVAAAAALTDAVVRLRRAFEAHHAQRPALLAAQVAAHTRDDARGHLPDGETAMLRDVMQRIRTDLDAAERYLR